METFLTEQEILARIKIYKSKNKADHEQFKFEVGILDAKNRADVKRKINGLHNTDPNNHISASNQE